MKITSFLAVSILSVGLGGCTYLNQEAYALPDGRKVTSVTETDALMTSRSIWAESSAGSGQYAPVAHMAVAGPLSTIGPSLIQGPIGWLFGPSSGGGGGAASNVFVTATGGNGGSATATSE